MFGNSFGGAYAGKKVFLTGHTGFKGSWLSLWLERLGAEVTGYALPPETNPSLFERADIASGLRHIEGDVRDAAALERALGEARPDFILAMAGRWLIIVTPPA